MFSLRPAGFSKEITFTRSLALLTAKMCARCREVLPVENFSRNRARPDGLSHYCRTCKAAAAAERYARRPEVVRKAARDWYTANTERALERARDYREANRDALRVDNRKRKAERLRAEPDRVRAEHRAWRAANRDRLNEKSRQQRRANPEAHRARVALWQAANREAVNEIKRRYKARKRAAVTVTFTADQLAQKVTHWGHCCWICRGPYQAVDHVKPLAKGGPHMLANLRPICTRCNSSKNDRWPFLAA